MNDKFEEQAINQIVDAANNDSLIIFVGAGVSAESGLPSWKNLIDEMRKELTLDDDINDYLKIAQFYYNSWGQQRYIQKIVDTFKGYEYSKPNNIHEQIFKIHPRHLITTNYDTLLEDKMNSGMMKYDVLKSDEDIPYSDSKHYLIKMHGDFSKKNMVLKEDDYLDYEKNFYMISTLIKSLIMNNTLLFIGYSLGDSTFNSIFRLIQNNFGDNAKKAYFYTPNEPQQPIVDYYKNKGIYVISNTEVVEFGNLGKSTADFLTKIEEKLKYKATNEEELWKKIQFLNQLNFIESNDVANQANIQGKTWLKYPDSFEWQTSSSKFSISNNSKIKDFLIEKTSLSNFLNLEIKEHKFKRNKILEPAYKLYKEKKYSESKQKFREIANDSYNNGKFAEFLIAEFNVLHITPSIDEINPKMSIPAYGNEKFDDIVDEMAKSADPDQRGIATFLKENIFSFKFVYRKMNRILELLNGLMEEHNTYINGGWSLNNMLSTLRYEFQSFINFVEYNCICIDQYKEFRLIIDKYFESLLLSFDNSTIPAETNLFIKGTSSTINQLELIDIKLLIPYLNYKMLPVYMDTYSISEIKISDDAYDFVIDQILTISEENKNGIKNIINYQLLNHYIELLKIVNVNSLNHIIEILKAYPVFNNPKSKESIGIILNIIISHQTLLMDSEAKELLEIITNHLNIIVNNNYEQHTVNFKFYSSLLSILGESKTNVYIKKFSEDLILINHQGKEITTIESYSNFIISFYKFFGKTDKDTIKLILEKYSKSSKKKIKYKFVIEMIENNIGEFLSLKEEIFEYLINEIKRPENKKVTSFPSPIMDPLASLYQLEEIGYFKLNKIREKKVEDLVKGKYPEVDWKWFDSRDDETIEKLLKNRTFAALRKYFGDNEEDRKIIDDWLFRQFDSESFRKIKDSFPNG